MVFLGVNGFMFFIGAMTLLISGVGIANIMYVAVRERSREIGTKMALGGERKHIIVQFLVEALAIVIGLLMLVMGLRSGMIIGAVLLLDVLGTFVAMDILDITLQRISLGALIIALGMLVDNAIVVTEGILVRLQQGVEREHAASESVDDVKWPLLAATLVAVLAFAAVSLSKGGRALVRDSHDECSFSICSCHVCFNHKSSTSIRRFPSRYFVYPPVFIIEFFRQMLKDAAGNVL